MKKKKYLSKTTVEESNLSTEEFKKLWKDAEPKNCDSGLVVHIIKNDTNLSK